jgi:hypothetical protein
MFTLQFDTGNAAFQADNGDDDPLTPEVTQEECARILREIAKRLDDGNIEGFAIDFNGNRVGSWKLAL